MGERQRTKYKGRKVGKSFVQIPHFIMESVQWGEMDAFAMKLLFEIVRQYKGSNNGDLSATVEMLKPRSTSWGSKDTLSKKLKHLEERGWIIKTRQGGRHIGCNLYAVTWWPVDASHKHQHPQECRPSHLWKNGIDTPPDGERKTVSRGAKPLAPRQTGSKTVSYRLAA